MSLMIIRMALVSLLTLGCSYTDTPLKQLKPQVTAKYVPDCLVSIVSLFTLHIFEVGVNNLIEIKLNPVIIVACAWHTPMPFRCWMFRKSS